VKGSIQVVGYPTIFWTGSLWELHALFQDKADLDPVFLSEDGSTRVVHVRNSRHRIGAGSTENWVFHSLAGTQFKMQQLG
jgi:hypothetical protein